MFLKNRKKEINPEGYGYIPNMLKAAKGLLLDDYKPFEKEIKSAIKEKKPYIIGIDGTKYYTTYIEPDNHKEWNRRYIEMAKEKDIKIVKRNGLDIQEIVTLNYVGDDLERYMFVYAQLKERLLQFNADELIENIKKLTAPLNIRLDYEKIEKIYQKYANSKEQYIVDFCREEIWHIKDIEAFKEVYEQLKQKGYLFIVSAYASDNRWFGVLDADTVMAMVDLQTIDIRTVNTLLTKHIRERYYSYKEQFEMFYKEIEAKITQSEYETIYIISSSDTTRESLSQIAGIGVGVDDESYPMYGDTPMQHVCTFDTKDFPNLAQRYPDTRAISLYISDFQENEAYEVDTNETKVLFLSQKDIETKKLNKSVPMGMDSLSMHIEPCKIPKGLLSKDILDYEEGSWKRELYTYIHNFNYVGGSATWIQCGWGVDASDGFIAQFGESLFENENTINFATGIMYLFENRAFWECL